MAAIPLENAEEFAKIMPLGVCLRDQHSLRCERRIKINSLEALTRVSSLSFVAVGFANALVTTSSMEAGRAASSRSTQAATRLALDASLSVDGRTHFNPRKVPLAFRVCTYVLYHACTVHIAHEHRYLRRLRNAVDAYYAIAVDANHGDYTLIAMMLVTISAGENATPTGRSGALPVASHGLKHYSTYSVLRASPSRWSCGLLRHESHFISASVSTAALLDKAIW